MLLFRQIGAEVKTSLEKHFKSTLARHAALRERAEALSTSLGDTSQALLQRGLAPRLPRSQSDLELPSPKKGDNGSL